MIVDKKGKLFGKISIVDAAIILFVIVVAAVLVFRAVGTVGFAPQGEETETKELTTICRYECFVEGIRIESVNGLKANIGKDVFDLHGNKLGTLVSVEETPYKAEMVTNNGTVVMAEVPEKYSAKIAFKGKSQPIKTGYICEAGYEIGIGSKPLLSFYTIDVEAQVLNITEEK